MLKTILSVVGGLFIFLIGVAVFTPSSTTPRVSEESREALEEYANKKAFMDECDDGTEGAYEYCVCSYDRIGENHGWDKAEILLDSMSDEELLDYFWDDFTYCMRQENLI